MSGHPIFQVSFELTAETLDFGFVDGGVGGGGAIFPGYGGKMEGSVDEHSKSAKEDSEFYAFIINGQSTHLLYP